MNANSAADPDHTAPEGEVSSGSMMFAVQQALFVDITVNLFKLLG